MITKLPKPFNFKTRPALRKSSLLTPMLIIILYLGGVSNIQAFQTNSFSEATETLTYDFNECASFSNDNSPWEYSEFIATPHASCSSVSGSQIYRTTGKHSCTDDEQGNAGDAACFQSSTDAFYTSNHTLAIRVDVELQAENGKASRLDGISFKQLAPHNYLWSADGFTSNTGLNNYPTKFGIRVLKDGSEIYRLSDLATTQSWYTSEFNFNHLEDFTVAEGTSSNFTFELYSYDPICNGAEVSAWDLDDLKIFSSCEEECTLTVDAGDDQSNCSLEEIILTANAENEADCSTIVSSYKIVNSNTEVGCFTADPGVIFQKGDGCKGIDYVWSAGNDLILNEYDNDTATITGSVIDQNGRVATVDIELSDKETSGTTWSASCYLDGISGPETYYRSFIGAITVDGVPQSVGTRFNAHYILANGAGFDSNQFGLGAWTGGAFGECTEWFGNLVPQTIDNTTSSISYLWSTGETTESITVTESGEYTVTATDCKGCTATDTVKVTIGDAKADAGDDITICTSEETTLSVEGEGTYLWSTGETTQTILVSPEATTEYSVTVTNDLCEATDTVTVNVSTPKAYVIEGGVNFCIDGEADYLNDKVVRVSGELMGANNTFVVTDSDGNILGLPATFEDLIAIDFDGAGAGTCLLWNLSFEDGLQGATLGANANDLVGCFDLSGSIKIIRSAAPEANAGDDVTICAGEEVMLTATGGGTYLWNTGETDASIKVSPTTETTYSVTVTSDLGCKATDEVIVMINNEVIANAGDDVTVCAGEEAMLTATGGGTYLWSTGETTASIKVLPTTETTYTVSVTSDEGCEASDEVIVMVNQEVMADAGDDLTICKGEEAMLTATGGGTYLWSTGETTASIKVTPNFDSMYSVTVTSEEGCEASDDVIVNVSDKVNIGNYVWFDENENGLQDDGAAGINDVIVTLYECNGTEVATTVTTDDASGNAGSYNFEVCPNSGYYFVSFEDTSELLEFTASNSGDDAQDSDANNNGITQCFKVEDIDIPTIDAGLIEICDIVVDAGENGEICEDEIVELTANILDDVADCPGGCVYPIKKQERCYGPTGDFEVYLVSTGSVENFKFVASEQKFERLEDGSVHYTATASNGKDVIEVDAMMTGYTQIAPINSPKANACQQYDTSDWEYWTTWSGTITSRDHGVFNLSVKGAAFQMGIGADMVRTGFGASGWFYVEGGDGFYTEGDINVTLEECVEDNVSYVWSTEDGNIVGDSNQKTIQVDQPGTYTVEAINCIDCVATDTVTLEKANCNLLERNQIGSRMSTVYPIPVQSGGTLAIEFDLNKANSDNNDELKSIPLKAGVDNVQRKEDVNVVLYNILGQMITAPRVFKVENGKATIFLDIDHIPSGKYILRAQGSSWSDAKNILVD